MHLKNSSPELSIGLWRSENDSKGFAASGCPPLPVILSAVTVSRSEAVRSRRISTLITRLRSVPHGESRNADSSLRISATVRNDNSESWLPEASYGLQRYESTLLINSLNHCEKSSPLEFRSHHFSAATQPKKSPSKYFSWMPIPSTGPSQRPTTNGQRPPLCISCASPVDN